MGRRLRGGAHAAAANGLSDNARVNVREATSADWEDVKELLAELGRPDVRDNPDEPQHRARFDQYLARDDTLALVAEHDGAVVGFVDVEFRQRLNFLQPEAWVPDLVVAEAARGIRSAEFPADPDQRKCGYCPYSRFCPHSAARSGA